MKRFVSVLTAVLLSAYAVTAYAAGEPGSQQEVQKVRIPQTAEEHRAVAQSYRLKAIAYEREAETHLLMCEEYKFKSSIPKNRLAPGPSLAVAQQHCEVYARDTADLAKNARELAEYHTAQAKALDSR